MSRTRLARVTLALAVITALAISCAPEPAPLPTVSPTLAPTTVPLVKITSAWSMTNADPAPLWIAQDVGFFKQNGLDVQLIYLDGGTKHAQALISKDVAIGVTSAAPVVSASAGGAELELVAGLVNVLNYDFIVRPSIKTGADLKGKKVAVSGASGSSATAMRLALRTLFNLDPDKDVATVSIGNESERETALLSGQIDATVVNPDTSIKAKKDGLVVLDSLWGKPIPYAHTGIGTTQSFAKANPQVVTAFLKSIIQATGYIRDPANKASTIKTIGKYLKLEDQEHLEQAYTRMSQTILACAPYVPMDGMKTVIGETKTAVDAGLKVDQVADNSFVKSLDDSGFVKANCR